MYNIYFQMTTDSEIRYESIPRDFLVLWCIKYGLTERTEILLRQAGYDSSKELLTLTKVISISLHNELKIKIMIM